MSDCEWKVKEVMGLIEVEAMYKKPIMASIDIISGLDLLQRSSCLIHLHLMLLLRSFYQNQEDIKLLIYL